MTIEDNADHDKKASISCSHENDLISRQAAIDEWKNDFKGYVNALNIPRDDYNGIMAYIDELPSAQPQRCSDILDELKDDDYYNYIHTGHSRFSEDDWDYLIHNAKEKEKLHEQLDIKADGDLCNRAKCGKEKR